MGSLPERTILRKVKGYPAKPGTIGEAIRKRRLDLGLRQIDAAESIGCNEMTIVNWEKGHTRPRSNRISDIGRFLGPIAKHEGTEWFGA
jgi:transcriptional regulator with XRE-family HTH domain